MPADDIGDGNVGSEGPVQPKVRSSVEYESLDARSNRLEALSSVLKADMADMIASQNRLPSTDSEADVEERLKEKVDRSGLWEVARQAGLAQREIRGRLNLKTFLNFDGMDGESVLLREVARAIRESSRRRRGRPGRWRIYERFRMPASSRQRGSTLSHRSIGAANTIIAARPPSSCRVWSGTLTQLARPPR